MNEAHLKRIADELNIQLFQVRAVAGLLADSCTIPFIARYRKEPTGSLDEVTISRIRERLAQLGELDKRRHAILKSLEERDLLTEELKSAILAAETLAVLEDVYLPFRPKRRTRATIAREKGLEPLAEAVFTQEIPDPAAVAEEFVDSEKGVPSVEEALAGARDIIAEWVNEDAQARKSMRDLFSTRGTLRSKVLEGKESEGVKFRDYFDWEEDVSEAPSHRVMAMFRGEKEGVLSVQIRPPQNLAVTLLQKLFVKAENASAEQVLTAVEDSYKRLLAPSMETEIRQEVRKRAEQEAIRVFSENLRELLLAPPLGQKRVMAMDPGYRTGAKLACLDSQGKLLHHETVYLTGSEHKAREAAETIEELCRRFHIQAIAIGNGTASRETESFVRSLDSAQSVSIVVVNESGASVYSASKAAREEFPDHDLTVRGAVSIARRLMDPLAELVKIDPKSIGVGQYQHDVDQIDLKRSLDDVVESCVNRVGVEVNTASKELLTYVSGLGPTLASNIIAWRNEHGPFSSREELRKVPRLGPKAFEQAAGFLRIRNGDNPLDASAVHPERYPIVEQMARDGGCGIADLMRSRELREKIDPISYVSEDVGLPTLTDIMEELAKPGRDPREEFETFTFAEGVASVEDLEPGMRLPGIVTNVTRFGAFVDIGVHRDGLIHISQLADRFVKDPAEVVKVRQKVMVTVVEVDPERNRISLSMRSKPQVQAGGSA